MIVGEIAGNAGCMAVFRDDAYAEMTPNELRRAETELRAALWRCIIRGQRRPRSQSILGEAGVAAEKKPPGS